MKKVLVLSIILCILSALMLNFSVYASEVKPVFYLKFDGDFKDSSGNGMDGVKIGAIDFSDNGVNGKSAHFKGGFLELSNSENILKGKKQYSISAWIKYDNDTSNETNFTIFAQHYDDYSDPHLFSIGYGISQIGFINYFISPDEEYPVTPHWVSCGYVEPDIMKEKWSHLVGVFDGQRYYVYLDGELLETNDMPKEYRNLEMYIDEESKVVIGKDPWSKTRGWIDEFKFFDTVLTDENVKALYNELKPKTNSKMVLKILEPKMIVNNVEKEIDPGRGTVPQIIDGRTLVPIRAIIEEMGGTVSWEGNEQRVDLTLKDKKVTLWINKRNVVVNGKEEVIDTTPQIINERTMLPLRFVAESFGAEVLWDGVKREITINYTK